VCGTTGVRFLPADAGAVVVFIFLAIVPALFHPAS